jgi:hypothetical protein
MKVFCVALSFLFLAVGFVSAQAVGEVWNDRTGLYVHYGDNANLLLRMDDHRFKMLFLDDGNVVRACPFKRVILEVDRRGGTKNDLHLVLRPTEGIAPVRHPRFIKPPYAFHVHILLCPAEEGDEGAISIPMTAFAWDVGASSAPGTEDSGAEEK